MIQALNSVNTNCCGTKRKQSFGHKHTIVCDQNGCYYEKPSKAKAIAGFMGREFITGALVSTVIDGLGNAWHAIRKNPDAMLGTKEIAKRAGFWGIAWIAMGAVIGLVRNSMRPRN